MDMDLIARKALYGPGGRELLEEAACRGLDFEALEKMGRDKAMRVLRDRGADDPSARNEGYLVQTARNEMLDALRRVRDIDRGCRTFSIQDWALHDRLQFDAWDMRAWRKRHATIRRLLPHWDNGLLGIYEHQNRSYNPRQEPERGRDLSDEGYRVANEILTAKERRVIDGVLAGKTQTEIGAEMDHNQPWVSKLFRRSIRKLSESGHAELEALSRRLQMAGRETRRGVRATA